MPSDTIYGTFEPGPPLGVVVIERTRRQRRRSCKTILLWLFFKILIVFAIISTFLWYFAAFAAELICYTNSFSPPFPLPPARDDFKNQSFAVGFDLTAGYA
ncbi:uncharacterized protein BDZ99DRAFT_74305 [Mytilinidion resinicola]|uniref:Uncharacterized protein n=1 Tax=Mytilinidion resinicola TaxID=574789 RepID=A0A6A6YGE1_9PEZI|nr:uncharacterized protein BDZ99DRAFT_74305 [Mytilinidion resinicola]KAF2807105.1 hypothetical protein BDZ99DRAFT_74305 [Mytilinidion resinicola]